MANNIDELSVLTSESKETIRRLLDIENGGSGGGSGEGSITSLQNIVDAENGGVVEGLVDLSVIPDLPAEGQYQYSPNQATGQFAHAEGGAYFIAKEDEIYVGSVIASGDASHAEGGGTTASGSGSHAEGSFTIASGDASHAEGVQTTASGIGSHAEGDNTTASGDESHAEGMGTIANHAYQHVSGTFNTPDDSLNDSNTYGNFVEIVGNGSDDDNRSNARTLDWDGNEWISGNLTIGGGTADEVTITAADLRALLGLINSDN